MQDEDDESAQDAEEHNAAAVSGKVAALGDLMNAVMEAFRQGYFGHEEDCDCNSCEYFRSVMPQK